MLAFGARFPTIRDDPEFRDLFSWPSKLPVAAYVIVATLVRPNQPFTSQF
jgi:hypothetical protein